MCSWLQLESVLILTDKKDTADWGKNSVNKYKLPTIKLAFGWLDKVLSADIDQEKDYEFWDSLNDANVLLTKLCLQPASIHPEDIVTDVKKYWIKTGAKSKLSSGLEHLNLLVTAARLSKQPKAKILIKALEKLNELLNKENV